MCTSGMDRGCDVYWTNMLESVDVFFRCGQGIGGLRDQGAINQVVYKFINHYDNLFWDENEDPPELQWVRTAMLCV